MSETADQSLAAGGALQRLDRVALAGRRLRLENRAVLVAVCALVFLVSLPRLQGIAIQENELDALRALELLARELEPAAGRGAVPEEIGALLSEGCVLRRRLGDVDLLSDGRLALRHGYLFELAPLRDGRTAVRAWPWRHGSTGFAAFVARPGEGILGHPNDGSSSSGCWSGPHSRPMLDGESGWRRLRLPGTRTESY